MLLSELVALVMEDIPQVDDSPTDLQYEQAVKDAVRDFSERCGVEQIGTLTIVSGTATYALPDDFLTMIVLETPMSADGVLHSSGGLIPIPAVWSERYIIRNGQITFHPTPTYSMTRDFRYKAGWVGTELGEYGDVDYETLGEREGRIVAIKAKSLVSGKKANAAAGESIKYSFGAVSEDLSSASEDYGKDAYRFQGEYLDACNRYNGSAVTAS